MSELNNNKFRRVADFYIGQSVFITGATGFMGKVLLEKLLYSCSGIKNVYILIRTKRERSVESRMEELLKLPIFQRIRKEKPDVLKKIVPVPGDIALDELGISKHMRKRLAEEVNIVFHGAATLKLEANLKDAVNMNTWGTWRVLQLAKEMKNLKVFVHVSTAFCHVDHEVLEEKPYDCKYKPEDIMNLVTWMDVKHLDKITMDVISPHPNTYTFTKRLAERLIINEFPKMPVCIARPSIVCPAHQEPLPGWVDNLNGPVGIMTAAAKGVLRSMYVKKDYTAELVPVDFAVNGFLVMAKEVGTQKNTKEMSVINITQAEERMATWGEILEKGRAFTFEYPFDVVLWFPDGNIRSSLWSHKFYAFFLHWVPAYLIDGLLFIFNQKRFMVRIQQKIHVGLEVLQYFTTHKWCFRNEKFLRLKELMCPEDKKEFNMDFKSIDELPYLKNCIMGAREYLLKEPASNLPKARRTMKIMYVLDRIVRFLFLFFFAQFIISMSGTATYVFEATSGMVKNMPFIRSFVSHDDIPLRRPV